MGRACPAPCPRAEVQPSFVVRVAALALTLSAAAVLPGCASRIERSHALSLAVSRERTPRDVRPRAPRFVSSPSGSEFVRASAIRLSLPGATLRDAPPPPQVVYVEVPVAADGAPQGACEQ